ncbi:MAG: hypothetical protein Q4G68_08310, partial [Planctomycetia bacterium]|nr:hypothetical protein [Planctomycetia bacterium]
SGPKPETMAGREGNRVFVAAMKFSVYFTRSKRDMELNGFLFLSCSTIKITKGDKNERLL